MPQAGTCITDGGVKWSERQLLTALIPPRDWLSDLGIELKARLRLGGLPPSVQHPTISSLCFPIWIATLWPLMLDIEGQKRVWTEAMAWLASEAAQGADTSRATELISDLAWGTTVWPLVKSGTLVGLITELLSTRWIRERHLDLWGLCLANHAGDDAVECYVGGVYLAQQMKELPNAKAQGKPWAQQGELFDTLAMIIKEGYQRVLLPANVNGNHWVLFRIDFAKKSFSYGMMRQFGSFARVYSHSKHHHLGDPMIDLGGGKAISPDISRLRDGVQIWLKSKFPAGFIDQGRTLPMGRQQDSYSCGVCVMNAMERGFFKCPPFDHANRHTLRVQYFIAIMEYLLDIVRRLSMRLLGPTNVTSPVTRIRVQSDKGGNNTHCRSGIPGSRV